MNTSTFTTWLYTFNVGASTYHSAQDHPAPVDGWSAARRILQDYHRGAPFYVSEEVRDAPLPRRGNGLIGDAHPTIERCQFCPTYRDRDSDVSASELSAPPSATATATATVKELSK